MCTHDPVQRRPPSWFAGVAVGICLVVANPQPVLASGLDIIGIGSVQSGPVTADPAALAYNPAMLGFIPLKRVDALAGLGIVVGRVGYERERLGQYQWSDSLRFKTPLAPEDLDPSKTGKSGSVSAIPVAPLGDAFLTVPLIHDTLTLGAGLYVPYAAPLHFPKEGAHVWQIQDATIIAAFLTAGVAWRPSEHFAVGGGLSYIIGYAELQKVLDFGSLDAFHQALAGDPIAQSNDFGTDAPSEVRELDALARPITLTNGISHGFSFNLGVAYKPSDAWTLGISYQHGSRMNFKGDLAINMNDPFFTQDLAAQGLVYKPLVKGDATLSFSLPKRITLGAAHEFSPNFRMDGFISLITYSDLDAFDVTTHAPDLAQPAVGIGEEMEVRLERNWKDTVDIGTAVRVRVSPKWLVSVGIGYQSPASPDGTVDLASPDGHRLVGALGGGVDLNDWLTLYLNGRVQGILPRTVTSSQYDLGNGRYTMFLGNVGGHLRARF